MKLILVGEGKKPIDAYLDIEGIIEIAKEWMLMQFTQDMDFYQKILILQDVVKKKGSFLSVQNSKHLDMFGDKVKQENKL